MARLGSPKSFCRRYCIQLDFKDEREPGKANQTWGNRSQNPQGRQVWLAHRGQAGKGWGWAEEAALSQG